MNTAEQNAINLRFIYYACDAENLLPIGASNTWDGLLEIVDDLKELLDRVGKVIKSK